MSEHTPGPWDNGIHSVDARGREQRRIFAIGGPLIAITPVGTKKEDIDLLTAPPDLYAATVCEEALDLPFEQARKVLEQHGWNYETRFELSATEFIKQLRCKAIAKAEGKSS
jgi:hypothetical protein